MPIPKNHQVGFLPPAHVGGLSRPHFEGWLAELLSAWFGRASGLEWVRMCIATQACPAYLNRNGTSWAVMVLQGKHLIKQGMHLIKHGMHATPDLQGEFLIKQIIIILSMRASYTYKVNTFSNQTCMGVPITIMPEQLSEHSALSCLCSIHVRVQCVMYACLSNLLSLELHSFACTWEVLLISHCIICCSGVVSTLSSTHCY